MRRLSGIASLGAVLLLLPGASASQGTGYMAMLIPVATAAPGLRGMAMVSATAVQFTLSGASPGATLPWHVHKGACGDDQGTLDAVDGYPLVTVGSDGRGAAKAVLRAPLERAGRYFVAVHAPTAEMKTVLACGELKPGRM